MEAANEDRPVITVDEIYEIFCQTVGSIKGAAGLLLWSWVTYSHLSWDVMRQATVTYLSFAWLCIVGAVHTLLWLNAKQVDGWGKYKLDPETDIIMITGGSNGLGLVLLATFSSAGFKTVNFDRQKPQIDISHSTYVHCDIADYEAVQLAMKGLPTFPSVLINCAGTVANSMGSLIEDVHEEDIVKLIQTNYMGTIWTTKTLLKLNPATKMVVGISSSTAMANPAFAGIYASSKAAVRSFYDSLRHELRISRPGKTRVLCVIPGQLDTAMFKDVVTPNQFLAPVVSSVNMAMKVYNAVLAGKQGELTTPLYAQLLPYILLLPQSIVDISRVIIGVDDAANPRRLGTRS